MAVGPLITVKCGQDWWQLFSYADADGNPIALTNPKMEIREAADVTSDVLFTSEGTSPTLLITQPLANEVLVTLPSAATKNTGSRRGAWDAYATDPNGAEVCLNGLLTGLALLTGNVTQL